MIFRFLFLLDVFFLVVFASNFILYEYPDLLRAFWKGGTDSSKIFSFAEILESLLLTAAGIFFKMDGG